MAEVRRLIGASRQAEEERLRLLWWSHFRRKHQAQAQRCHQERRARQAPLLHASVERAPIRLAGLSAVTDTQWEKIRQLLPKYVSQTRRPVANPRLIVEAIVWMIGTGSSWREIPERFGPWSNVAERYYRWCREGKWSLILQILQEQDVPLSSSA